MATRRARSANQPPEGKGPGVWFEIPDDELTRWLALADSAGESFDVWVRSIVNATIADPQWTKPPMHPSGLTPAQAIETAERIVSAARSPQRDAASKALVEAVRKDEKPIVTSKQPAPVSDRPSIASMIDDGLIQRGMPTYAPGSLVKGSKKR